MIWVTWRQARLQILVLAGAVAVLGVAMAAFSLDAAGADPQAFLARLRLDLVTPALYTVGSIACLAAPPVIGAFWGAPLIARELETGTFRLAWSQGVSRTRWLAFKLGGPALAAAALTAVLSLGLTWWAGPIDRAVAAGGEAGVFGLPRMAPVLFSARGVVPVAYAVAAVCVGALLGLLTRRTVAALALTLVAMIGLLVVMMMFVRPHLMAPRVTSTAITADNLTGLLIGGDPQDTARGRVLELRVGTAEPGGWELSNETVDRAGNVQSSLPPWVADCGRDPMMQNSPDIGKRNATCFARLAAEGFHQQVRTQPQSHFWGLQWRESAVLLLVAAPATGACFARLRR
jgi:hypothetical protein